MSEITILEEEDTIILSITKDFEKNKFFLEGVLGENNCFENNTIFLSIMEEVETKGSL